MIIKSFKIFESRSTELSEDEFRKILKSECKDFIKNPMILQRSKKKPSSQYSFIDPSKFIRTQLKDETVGVQTQHHLLLMENLPSWNKFPLRSKSIIGVTNESTNTSYGLHRYLVIPFDGAKFGVAPGEDLWTSECKLIVQTDDIYKESGYLGFAFDDRFSDFLKHNSISDNSYYSMMRDLQTKLEDTVVDFKYKYYDHGRDVINMQNLMSLFKTNGFNDVESAFDNYFAPDKFKSYRLSGFKIMDYNNLSQYSINDNLEFWTESPCLIYYLEKLSGFGSESLEEKWNIFLEKFIS
jgi:hypothetical protein